MALLNSHAQVDTHESAISFGSGNLVFPRSAPVFPATKTGNLPHEHTDFHFRTADAVAHLQRL